MRQVVAATALAAAAVLAGSGVASAGDGSGDGMVQNVLTARCNDFTTQEGLINLNQGPVCVDFDSNNAGTQKTDDTDDNYGGEITASCNSFVNQYGLINVNQGPVCVDF
ncbi:hypothetical protein [Streptomyces sp. B1I3]|uniref:hypothetical protein n=1 Tax=Streptomyces sp. B1I3 TaxID=3042264 RepID=UPI0027D9047C|nr:hypothetical protein [Streptomyces sp. B1I3]